MGRPKLTDKRICSNCNSDSTYIDPGGNRRWRTYKDGYLCWRCGHNIIDNPKHHPINNPKLLNFKGKHILLKESPRKGKCQWCGKRVGDMYFGGKRRNKLKILEYTQIHHIAYHDDDPLKDTVELCSSCHTKEGLRLGQLHLPYQYSASSGAATR